MKLLDDITYDVEHGEYTFSVVIGTGTCTFKFGVDGGAMIAVDDGAFSATANGTIRLPVCQFQAVLTGDAIASLIFDR